jgi:transposase InsO family protein
MPWRAVSVMDEKLSFIAEWLRGDEPRASLCGRYGISRETGYEWWRRYEAEGPSGLVERSRAPHRHGRSMPAHVAAALIALRRSKPYWGPKKLLAILRERTPEQRWPSPSTVSELFRREGLSEPRRRVRRMLEVGQPFAGICGANDAWCIDFKGWFRTGDGERCDPLTVSDAYSRYLLGLRIVEPVGAAVTEQMDELFRRHGLPAAIRSDNGPPFASGAAGGLTRVSARWAKLGIRLERIQPGRPEQNGRHERMHWTLKREACRPPSANARAQQARFDAFRAEFNQERPHEALGQIPPARVYASSPRPMPDRIAEPIYDADEEVRHVRTSGEIRWRGGLLFVSEALVGEAVAIRERDDGHYLIRFADVPLLLIDRTTGKAARFGPGRPPRTKAPQPKNEPELSGM